MLAEAWSAAIVGSRLALARPRLRRLTALSRRAPRAETPRWSRRSVLGMRPRLVVADHGVECGEQLAHDGDEGEASRFAGLAQASVEASQRWVVPDGDQTGHIERRAHLDASTLDAALAAIA